jgi:hypothetical protein
MRFAAAAWRRVERVGMIDLDALKREADRDERDCVVTRRWLRKVHAELTEARKLQAALADRAPSLDFKALERR